MTTTTAIGIARQSHGDGASVEEQTARIRKYAKEQGWKLLDVLPEQDVSGGRSLDKRPGLSKAVEAVESGRASIIVVAYFDRLVRSVKVQAEVTERVEAAGGRILTLDVGEVSSATAASWLSAQFLGTVAEYHRRSTSERVKASHATKRSAGLWSGGRVPFYKRATGVKGDTDRRVEWADADVLAVVTEAFKLRVEGASEAGVLDFCRDRTGLPLKSLNIVQRMLRDESLIGVAVDGATFRRVQSLHTKRGPRPKSDRILARLDVLHCATCVQEDGEPARMNVHGSGSTQVYRCHSCGTSVSVGLAEDTVEHETRKALREYRGAAGESLEALEARVTEKSANLERAVIALTDFSDTESIKSKLAVMKGELDAAEDALAEARTAAGFTMSPSLDWRVLTRSARRELIRGVVASARVRPGRGTTEVYTEPTTGDTFRLSPRIEVELSATFQVATTLDEAARELRDELALVPGNDPEVEARMRAVA